MAPPEDAAAADLPAGLRGLQFENRFRDGLPGDPETANEPRQVEGACWSPVDPTPVRAPQTLAWTGSVAADLGLDAADCDSEAFAQVFAGNRLLDGMAPYAMCYGGHQFGHWAGQLGDGRAINLGEVRCPDGVHRTLQLKGAGPTPYSRTADGRAVLRSSLREFLCSEAMFHLGVPTTRALSLVGTGEQVLRDMFYDGHAEHEPGAVVCRVSRSFTRFGHFEIHAARGDVELLRTLADHTIRNDFPELGVPAPGEALAADHYVAWFAEVARRTLELVVHWERVGFVHGVMNTDNLSILGETIDYGPYGWLEDYDPDWTPNTTDAQGRRYRFGNQAPVAHWNLTRLASALVPLVGEVEPLQAVCDAFPESHGPKRLQMLAAKAGFEAVREGDEALLSELHDVMRGVETDRNLFYTYLADVDAEGEQELDDVALTDVVLPACYFPSQVPSAHRERLANWLRGWSARVRAAGRPAAERAALMHAVNPRYVLRNWMAQQAIDAAEKGELGPLRDLQEVLTRPYEFQARGEPFAARRPEWARHRPGCSMLSCSS